MKLKKALKDFYISEVNICYKDKIIKLINPSDIKMHEEDEGLITFVVNNPKVGGIAFAFNIIKDEDKSEQDDR